MKIVLCTLAGFALGYTIAKKQLEQRYLQIANDEVALAEAHYKDKWETKEETSIRTNVENVRREDIFMNDKVWLDLDSSDVADVAATAMTSYQTGVVPQQSPDEIGPYVINVDEFLTGEKDYEQVPYTYYEGDKVLVDSQDKAITAVEVSATVGHENLQRFGEQSEDEDSVYVRNDKLCLDFEIVRSHGKYSVEVLGLDTVSGDHE